jgi:hypothetical protein
MPSKLERHYCVFPKAIPVKKWTLLVCSAAETAGIATNYMLEGPGFDSRWEQGIFFFS